jgi:2-polyprenyl-6-methoxyphenol hydroxylase-like FAD-dependent oxidoreductase
LKETLPVCIVGAGVCGLAAAITLAREGRDVEVLERRIDPKSKEGRRGLHLAEAMRARGNEKRARGADASSEFNAARAMRAKVWGTRVRAVLVDVRAVQYLEALEVDTSALPKVRSMRIGLGEGEPAIDVRVGERKFRPSLDALDPKPLTVGRDFAVACMLAEVEALLRDAVAKLSNVTIRFESEVVDCQPRDDGPSVCWHGVDGERVTRCSVVILADGGGGRAFSRWLGERHTLVENTMHYAVFEEPTADSTASRDAVAVLERNSFGLAGFVFAGAYTATGVLALGEASGQLVPSGFADAPVMDDAQEIMTPIDRARQMVHGDVLLAGDAAARGSAALGLGVAYALLWARTVSRHVLRGPEAPDHKRYERAALAIADGRLAFEAASMELLALWNAGLWRMAEAVMSRAVVACLDRLFIRTRADGGVDVDFAVDFARMMDAPEAGEHQPEAHLLCHFGVIELKADLKWSLSGKAFVATVTAERPIILMLADQELRVVEGRVALARSAAGWEFILMNAQVHRHRSRLHSAPDTQALIEDLTIALPEQFIDRLSAALPAALCGLGDGVTAPVIIELGFPNDVDLELGPLRLRLAGATTLVLRAGTSGHEGALVTIDVTSGALVPLSITEFAHDSRLRSVRWLSSLSGSTQGAFDGVVDVCAAVAAGSVDRVSFLMNHDGSAVAYFKGVISAPVFLSSSDVTSVFRDLLGSNALAAGVRGLAAGF